MGNSVSFEVTKVFCVDLCGKKGIEKQTLFFVTHKLYRIDNLISSVDKLCCRREVEEEL